MPLAESNGIYKRQHASNLDFGGIADSYDNWYSTAHGFVYDGLEKKAIDRLLPNGGNVNPCHFKPSTAKVLTPVAAPANHW